MPSAKERPIRPRLATVVGLVLLVLLVLPRAAGAASYDPRLRWRTVTTPHFRIHFHQGTEHLAFKAARVAEEVHVRLVPELKWEPRTRTDLVILDNTDSANGFAQTIPYRAITIYATAPLEDSSLDHYEDWLWALLVHEYAHILHIDTTLGVNRVIQAVIGRLWVPNGIQPGWLTEGLATYEETVQTAGGRGRSAYTEMIWRASALEGTFPGIDQAEGYQADWPGGQIRYLYGAGFHLWLASRFGDHRIAAFSHAHARQVIPFILPSRRIFGRSFPTLWGEWRQEMEQRAAADRDRVLERGGPTPSTVVAGAPYQATQPVWTPDSRRLLYVRRDLYGPTRVMSLDPDTRREEVYLKKAPRSMAWGPKGHLYFSEVANFDPFNAGYDLFRYDPVTRKVRRLTRGRRARDPAPSPGDGRVLCVVNDAQMNHLAWVGGQGQVHRLGETRDYTQFSDLVWSPDGSMLALSAWKEGGRRDIHVLDPVALERWGDAGIALADDRASEIDPTFSPDGRWLLFASDRSGIWNVYAWSVADGSLRQVTDEIGGAFSPAVSPDGRWLAYQGYTSTGYDVRILPYRPETWSEPQPTADPEARWLAPPPRPLPPPPEAELPLPSRPYNPVRTLFPPRYLSPSFSFNDTGFVVGLSTGGFDVLRQHSWGASANYRSDSGYFGWGVGYTNDVLYPKISLGFSTYTVSYGKIWLETAEPSPPGGPGFDGIHRGEDTYFERRDRAYASASVPTPDRHHAFFARYVLDVRRALREVPGDAHTEFLPDHGSFSGIDVGWTWSDTSSYGRSVSPEAGRSFSARAEVKSKYLGAGMKTPDGEDRPLEQVVLTGEGRGYVSMPWKRGHVLAIRGALGTTLGTQEGQYSFRMGGSFGDSAFISLPDRYYPLRGYPTSSVRGDHLLLLSAEYRLPVFFLERSLSTLPVYLRDVDLSLFADAGQAWDSGDNPSLASILSGDADLGDALLGWLQDLRVGIGAEIGVHFALGWGGFLRLRLGAGVGLTDGALSGFPENLYWQLGSSF